MFYLPCPECSTFPKYGYLPLIVAQGYSLGKYFCVYHCPKCGTLIKVELSVEITIPYDKNK